MIVNFQERGPPECSDRVKLTLIFSFLLMKTSQLTLALLMLRECYNYPPLLLLGVVIEQYNMRDALYNTILSSR